MYKFSSCYSNFWMNYWHFFYFGVFLGLNWSHDVTAGVKFWNFGNLDFRIGFPVQNESKCKFSSFNFILLTNYTVLLFIGNYIGAITALVTWRPLRPCWVRTKNFQTMFLIWIFISVKLSFQRYQIRPHLDNLIFFHHYDVIPEMTSLPGSCPHFEQVHGGSFFFIYVSGS